MAEFLSDAWLDELGDAATSTQLPDSVDLTIQQVVVDDDGEQAYALRISGGRLEVHRGRVPQPDVTFTQDRATASAITRGELSAQAAFLAGRLRIGGDIHRLARQATELSQLDDLFAALRAVTTY